MVYDALLKSLFERSARGLLRALTTATVTEWINVELPKVNVPRMDLFGRFSDGTLWNIEFQTTNEPLIAERVGMYYLAARTRYGEDVHQVVIYLGREPMRMPNSIDTTAMQFQFRLVDIAELDGEELASSGDLGDAMLAVLARVRSRKQTIRKVLDRIARLGGKGRELAVEQLAILAGLRGLEIEIIKEAREYMPFVVDLMENKIFRARYESGLEEGREEGRTEGELKLFRTLLKKRFGRLPAWAKKQIDSATAGQVEAWSLNVLEAKTLDDVFGRR
jgi:predicted transposase YdaD